tara:strand:+ start:714 stop:1160 length:447 start_codon:yes stop_codon:yes gene_type:complete
MTGDNLSYFLKNKSYFKIKLHMVKSNHFTLISKINGVKGVFILDTGASSSFVDLKLKDKYNLKLETSKMETNGAGPEKLMTLVSKNNSIKVGEWACKKFQIALIDLSNINDVFKSIETSPVDGIIGADILKKGNAIIDYEKKYLYLNY